MKIFVSSEKYTSKINFVDENNVFVGYDTDHQCCEFADWFIDDKKHNDITLGESNIKLLQKKYKDIESYRFRDDWFEQTMSGEYDETNIVRFMLIDTDYKKPPLYLHLFNMQNGCYGHGFEATIQNKLWHSGTL